jgi:hypothetical protein
MKNLMTKFQKIMAAAAFAEAGEWNTAREMTPDAEISREPGWLHKVFTAITFAESNLHEEALFLLEQAAAASRTRHESLAVELGLKGVRLVYCTVSI